MQWQDVQTHFPDQWVLFEALEAHTEENRRIIEQLAVINVFPDSESAMKGYLELHRQFPGREFYVFHTSRDSGWQQNKLQPGESIEVQVRLESQDYSQALRIAIYGRNNNQVVRVVSQSFEYRWHQ